MELVFVVVKAFSFCDRKVSKVVLGRSVSGRDGNVCLVSGPDEKAVPGDDGELVLALDGGLDSEEVLGHRCWVPVRHRVQNDGQAVLDAPVWRVIDLVCVVVRNFFIRMIKGSVFKKLFVLILYPFDHPRQLLSSQHRPQRIVIECTTESDVRWNRIKYFFARNLLALPHAVSQQLATGLSREPEETENDFVVTFVAEVHLLEQVVSFFVDLFELKLKFVRSFRIEKLRKKVFA